MQLWKCDKCKHIFREDEAHWRDDGSYEEFWGYMVKVPYDTTLCPECESEDVEEYFEEEEEVEEDDSN